MMEHSLSNSSLSCHSAMIIIIVYVDCGSVWAGGEWGEGMVKCPLLVDDEQWYLPRFLCGAVPPCMMLKRCCGTF